MICDMRDFHLFLNRKDTYGLFKYADEKYKSSKCYRVVVIKKKNGGMRILQAPSHRLRYLQGAVLRLLKWGEVSEYATAYKTGGSCLENAKPHVGAKMLVKLDIENFFGSITFPQVFHAIDKSLSCCPQVGESKKKKEGNQNYNSELSWYFAKICTCEGSLPQGAPTSPMLSNLVFSPIDKIIGGYCSSRNITYTRYSDDMTFSGDFHPGGLVDFIEELLERNKFHMNCVKTVVAGPGSQQKVTGVVVNEKPQAERTYRRQIRQELYYIGKYGIEEHLLRKAAMNIENQKGQAQTATELRRLLGRIDYVMQLDKNNEEFKQYKKECLRLLELLPRLQSEGGFFERDICGKDEGLKGLNE